MKDYSLEELQLMQDVLDEEINSSHYKIMMFVVCPVFYALVFGLWWLFDCEFNAAIGLIGTMAGFHVISMIGLLGYYIFNWIIRRSENE